LQPLVFFVLLLLSSITAVLADRYEDCGQSEDLERTINGCTQVIESGENETTEKRRDAYLLRANAHYNNGDYDRAIADTTRAIELDPKSTTAYSIRGLAYSAKGDSVRANADYYKSDELTRE